MSFHFLYIVIPRLFFIFKHLKFKSRLIRGHNFSRKMWPPWPQHSFPTTFSPILIILPFIGCILLSKMPFGVNALRHHHRRPFLPNVAESELDANRSILVDGERIFVAKTIPKMSRAEKRRLILEQFHREGLLPPDRLRSIEWTMRASSSAKGGGYGAVKKRRGRKQKKRRDLPSAAETKLPPSSRPWRNHYSVRRRGTRGFKPLLTAKNTAQCPNTLDAVTEGFNKRLYLFAGDMVYEVWRDCQGLQQRQAYPIEELFPDGPRRVTAALTNQKSGVTLLLDWRQVYRYRWNRRHKRFYLAQKSPRELPRQIDFVPRIGFQWKDGHLILANKDKFVSYDPYWNLATFASAKVGDYFPNLAVDQLAGVVRHGRQSILWMSSQGKVQLYDVEKHRLGLELPLNLTKILACLQTSATQNSTSNPLGPIGMG